MKSLRRPVKSLRELMDSLKKPTKSLKKPTKSQRSYQLSLKRRNRLQQPVAGAVSIQQTINVATARLGLHQAGAMPVQIIVLHVESGAKTAVKRLSMSRRKTMKSLRKLMKSQSSSPLSLKRRKMLQQQVAGAASIQPTINVATARLGLHQAGVMLVKRTVRRVESGAAKRKRSLRKLTMIRGLKKPHWLQKKKRKQRLQKLKRPLKLRRLRKLKKLKRPLKPRRTRRLLKLKRLQKLQGLQKKRRKQRLKRPLNP